MFEINNIQESATNIHDLFLVYANNILSRVFCNYIIDNYNTTKDKHIGGVNFVNPTNKNMNDHDKKDFNKINNWSNDKELELLKNTVYDVVLKYYERIFNFYDREYITGTYLNDTSTFSYRNNDGEFDNINNLTLLSIDDFEFYYQNSTTILPISYEIINENTQISINSEDTFIKRTDIFMNQVRAMIFLNTVEDGYLVVGKNYKVKIEYGKVVIIPNCLLYNYEICTSKDVHLITYNFISSQYYKIRNIEDADNSNYDAIS